LERNAAVFGSIVWRGKEGSKIPHQKFLATLRKWRDVECVIKS